MMSTTIGPGLRNVLQHFIQGSSGTLVDTVVSSALALDYYPDMTQGLTTGSTSIGYPITTPLPLDSTMLNISLISLKLRAHCESFQAHMILSPQN